MWSDDGKHPGNARPPSIAIYRCQNFYQTPSELGDRSISKMFFFVAKKTFLGNDVSQPFKGLR